MDGIPACFCAKKLIKNFGRRTVIMVSNDLPGIRTGATVLSDEKDAVADLFEKIRQPDMHSMLFFCSSRYDLDRLGAELKRRFPCKLIGCTTAGEISSGGYQEGGIVGVGFASRDLILHPHIIHPLTRFTPAEARKLEKAVRNELVFSDRVDGERMFGLLLIDGMSILEEQVVSYVYSEMDRISIVGGSAGDDMAYEETKIYFDGRFVSGAAVFTLFETMLPFTVFKTQHYRPTNKKMVITEADPSRRIVSEINAEPAAKEYARVLGVTETDLCPEIFTRNPVMVKIADNWQVRSIQQVNEDGSLSFYCAIDVGLVITLAESGDIIGNIKDEFDRLAGIIPTPRLTIMCDCICRKLELVEKGLQGKMRDLMTGKSVLGFSTYGEQFNAIHINQTLTGVMIGA
jgi:hypothetical protein